MSPSSSTDLGRWLHRRLSVRRVLGHERGPSAPRPCDGGFRPLLLAMPVRRMTRELVSAARQTRAATGRHSRSSPTASLFGLRSGATVPPSGVHGRRHRLGVRSAPAPSASRSLPTTSTQQPAGVAPGETKTRRLPRDPAHRADTRPRKSSRDATSLARSTNYPWCDTSSSTSAEQRLSTHLKSDERIACEFPPACSRSRSARPPLRIEVLRPQTPQEPESRQVRHVIPDLRTSSTPQAPGPPAPSNRSRKNHRLVSAHHRRGTRATRTMRAVHPQSEGSAPSDDPVSA